MLILMPMPENIFVAGKKKCPTCGQFIIDRERDLEITTLAARGISLAEIGRRLGVDRRRIWQLVHGRLGRRST